MSILVRSIGITLAVIVVLAVVVIAVYMVRRSREKARGLRVKKSSATQNSITNLEPRHKPNAIAASPERDHVKRESFTSSSVMQQSSKKRLAVLSTFGAGVLALLASKLYFLQIVTRDDLQSAAERNKYKTISTPAPRGLIYDADGVVLVDNRAVSVVLADASVLKSADIVKRLSVVLGIPIAVVRRRIADTSTGAQGKRVVASDISFTQEAYIREHIDAFGGISIEKRTIRSYPYKALAAHVLGYTGKVSQEDLKTVAHNRHVELGDDVGKNGVEYTYDQILAGEHGRRRVIADTNGTVVGVVSDTAPVQGSDLYLTIKAPLQYVADAALAQTIAPRGVIGEGHGVAGAAVLLDMADGGIVALSSYPTYNPETFIGGISREVWDVYSSQTSHYPLLNRAVSGTYPAASTFKTFTGLAGLKYGLADFHKTWHCTGAWDGFHSGNVQHCWLRTGHGYIGLRRGIIQSCDVVFYEIALNFFYAGHSRGGTLSDEALQEEIGRYNFGKKTGIDLPAEEVGRIPTPEWKRKHWRDVPTEGVWRGGDLTNMVIGQGDVLITPIQLAVAYGAVATGHIVRPHVLKQVKNGRDVAAVSKELEIIDTPDVNAEHLEGIKSALNAVASATPLLRTAYVKEGINPDSIACKTGTAQVKGSKDFGWIACYYPSNQPRYVCTVIIEQGGGGAATAGPVSAKILSALQKYEHGNLKEVEAIEPSSGRSVKLASVSTARND